MFLGQQAVALAEPLTGKNVYRKHPEFGIFYQNWHTADLVDGDVLRVQHHDEIFTAANEGARQIHKLACPDPPSHSSDGQAEGKDGRENRGWRGALWSFVTDSTSSRCTSRP